MSSRPDGRAFRVKPARDGVIETPLPVAYLGDTPTVQDAGAPARKRPSRTRKAVAAVSSRKARSTGPQLALGEPAGPQALAPQAIPA